MKLVVGQSAARKKKKSYSKHKLNIDGKLFSRKQNLSWDNVFSFETLHVTPRRHICLMQTVIFVIY